MKTTPDYITKPLTLQEVQQKAPGNQLTITVAVELDDIIKAEGMEGFNDLIEEKVADGWIMEDINYHPVGTLDSGEILIEVNCGCYEIE